jgi:hypothetical protein
MRPGNSLPHTGVKNKKNNNNNNDKKIIEKSETRGATRGLPGCHPS